MRLAALLSRFAMAAGLILSGSTGATIARGELNFDTKPEARSLTGMMSVTAPLKVKIRWELTPQ